MCQTDVIIAIIFVFTIAYSYYLLKFSEKRATQRMEKTSPDRLCRSYLVSIKANSMPAAYGLLTASISGLILFLIFKTLQQQLLLNINVLYALVLIITVITFGVSYKVLNCFLARSICPDDCGILDYK